MCLCNLSNYCLQIVNLINIATFWCSIWRSIRNVYANSSLFNVHIVCRPSILISAHKYLPGLKNEYIFAYQPSVMQDKGEFTSVLAQGSVYHIAADS